MDENEVTRETEVEAAPAEVWRSLTEPERLAGWLADEAELEFVPGGDLSLCDHDGVARTGWVERVDEPSRLTFWWSPRDGEATRVELDLEETEAGGTRVRVTESRPLARLERELSEAGRGGAEPLAWRPPDGGVTRGPLAVVAA